MTERVSHELASLLAEGDGRPDRSEWHALVRARLAGSVCEGLSGVPPVQGEPDTGAELARIAAFLDGAAPQSEREAFAARLADDHAVRSDVASAAALLDDIVAEPATVPPGLVARAVGEFAAEPTAQRSSVLASALAALRLQRPMWPALAAVVLVVAALPVVSLVWNRGETPDVKGAPVDRGIVAAPAGTAKDAGKAKDKKEKDVRSCDDVNQPAGGADQPPDRAAETAKVTGKPDRPGDSSAADEDPCRPKSADRDKQKREPSADRH
jgi:hypothetical protein